jgi:hypothetical protein
VAAIARRGVVPDSPETRSLGWIRMSLLVLYFNPADILLPMPSFDALRDRLMVGPVLETLVYSKARRGKGFCFFWGPGAREWPARRSSTRVARLRRAAGPWPQQLPLTRLLSSSPS